MSGVTPQHIPLILVMLTSLSYFPHGQRPPREPHNKPHHILIQTLKRLAGSDKTSLTLTSTLLSVRTVAI